jgi:S1-C subfamily serine protease
MNAIQGSAQAAGSQQSPSSPEQPGGGIPYGSYGGSAGGSYGTPGYGAAGYGGTGGYGGGGWSGGNWNGGSNYPGGPTPPSRGRRIRRGLAIGTAGVALAAAAAVGWYDAVQPSGSSAGKATTSANTNLTTAQIASKVDPGLVDVVSTLGYQKATAEGTGMVLTSTGEILTNNHVIDGATSIKVIDIGNGKTYTASVVGYNASRDIAVLQLQNASGLSTVSLGNSSSVTVGSKVTALGNAGGKEGTPSVATGSVTALSQSITASDEGSGNSEQLTGLIQSNAPIQAGDSGGPLVNSAGQVIGIDTAASSSSESPNAQADTPGTGDGWGGFGDGDGSGSTGSGSTGSGSTGSGSTAATQAFSIPINEAVTVAKQIVAGDASSTVHIGTTGFLGIEVSSADSSSSTGGFGESGGFGGTGTGTTTSGATVEGTLSGSPAATAGLAAGDVITSVAGQSVTSSAQISSILSSDHPGDKVTVTWTDTEGQSHTASIALASGPAA